MIAKTTFFEALLCSDAALSHVYAIIMLSLQTVDLKPNQDEIKIDTVDDSSLMTRFAGPLGKFPGKKNWSRRGLHYFLYYKDYLIVKSKSLIIHRFWLLKNT